MLIFPVNLFIHYTRAMTIRVRITKMEWRIMGITCAYGAAVKSYEIYFRLRRRSPGQLFHDAREVIDSCKMPANNIIANASQCFKEDEFVFKKIFDENLHVNRFSPCTL